jgi:hypothetical protein
MKPPQTFPFQGEIWNADAMVYFGKATGLFYRNLAEGDTAWRGEHGWSRPPSGKVEVGRHGDSQARRA